MGKKLLAPERLVDVLVEVEGGEDENPWPLLGTSDAPADRLEPVEVRHAHVYKDDVGAVPLGSLDRLAAFTRFVDDRDVRLGVEDHTEARRHQLLILGHDDEDTHGRSASNDDARPGFRGGHHGARGDGGKFILGMTNVAGSVSKLTADMSGLVLRSVNNPTEAAGI